MSLRDREWWEVGAVESWRLNLGDAGGDADILQLNQSA